MKQKAVRVRRPAVTQQHIDVIYSSLAQIRKRHEELQWDVTFLADHLKLQRNNPLNNNPRFIPYPKPPKVKFMRRFWNAVLGR